MGETIQAIAAWSLLGLGGITAAVGLLACLLAVLTALSGIAPSLRSIAPMGRSLIRHSESAGRAFGRGIAGLALVMVLVQFLLVLARYVFSVNSIAIQESVTYMHAALFLLAAGYTLLEDGHVRVDIFYRGMGPRAQAAVNLAGAFLFLMPFAALILWWSLPYVEASWATLEGSPQPGGLPIVFLLKTIIPAFGVLMILHGGLMAARAAFAIAGIPVEARDGVH